MNLKLVSLCVHVLLIQFLLVNIEATSSNQENKAQPKKKSIVDFSDADIERLYDEWEENDPEKLPEDELPEYLRKPPQLNINDFKDKKPDELKYLSKKDRAVMIFATVSGNPSRHETDDITTLWQSSLFNANYEVTRYIVEDNRSIFMVKDGSKAWEIKDFLVKQDRCEEVTIDNEIFYGKNYSNKNKNKSDL